MTNIQKCHNFEDFQKRVTLKQKGIFGVTHKWVTQNFNLCTPALILFNFLHAEINSISILHMLKDLLWTSPSWFLPILRLNF